jgi:hypothetical protein
MPTNGASKALNSEPVMHKNSPTSICDSKYFPGVIHQTPMVGGGFGAPSRAPGSVVTNRDPQDF